MLKPLAGAIAGHPFISHLYNREKMPTELTLHPASFRDPSGFVFLHNGVLYRQVNQVLDRKSVV